MPLRVLLTLKWLTPLRKQDRATLHRAAVLRENMVHNYKVELAKWTEADEMCKLSNAIAHSRTIVSVNFNNFIEEWEAESIMTKNQAHEDRLTDKYRHLYFFDRDSLEIRRIIQIEWKVRARGVVAQHACVTALIKSVEQEVSCADNSDEEEYEPYFININLHEMIKDAPHPYNSGRNMVGAE